MALCELCQAIPFDSLPSVLDDVPISSRVADNRDMPRLSWDESWNLNGKEDSVQSKEAIGYAWHDSFETLAASAKSACPLCALVQVGVQNWLDNYHETERSYPGWAQFYKESEVIPNGKTLWLSRRLGGREGTGFVVLVRTISTQKRKGAYFLTSINFSVAADSDLASKFPSRPIEQDSGSRQSLDVAASLVSRCVEKHDQCNKEETLLPSRVLDIGSTGDIIKLIDCPDSMRGRYISLSHCWGASETLTTTRESYKERTSGILLSHLPKTFLDAVIITRHLGIRYVWIDSLCIMQEGQEDWARESARMTDVYSNAYLVIAANHAKDGDAGCFHQRPSRPQTNIALPGVGEICAQLLHPKEEWSAGGLDFAGEPLSERGWALQERVLARRILHYSSWQIYLECDHGIVSESGCIFNYRYCCKLSDLGEPKGAKENKGENAEPNPERIMWKSLLWSYGTRELSKATDKLPAISGLAKLFKSRFKAEYVAGLWSDNLIEGLAWQGIGNRAPNSTTRYTGPTWSWASYDGIAATGLRGRWTNVAQIEDWHVELRNESNPFGEVKNAWIRVHGPVADLKLSEVEETDHEVNLKEAGETPFPRLRTRYSEKEEGRVVSIDYEVANKSGEWREWEMQVMMLCGKKDEDDESESHGREDDKLNKENGPSGVDDTLPLCYGLVVTKAGNGQDSRMKRVGWMFLEGEEANNLRKDKGSWSTVTLV